MASSFFIFTDCFFIVRCFVFLQLGLYAFFQFYYFRMSFCWGISCVFLLLHFSHEFLPEFSMRFFTFAFFA